MDGAGLDDLHSEEGYGRQADKQGSRITRSTLFPSTSRATGEDRTGAELAVVSRLPVGLTRGPQILIDTIKFSVSVSVHMRAYVCESGGSL